MKKLTLAFATLLALTVISCRNSEDALTNDDYETISRIEESRNSRPVDSSLIMKKDSTANYYNSTTDYLDGEIQSPPRK